MELVVKDPRELVDLGYEAPKLSTLEQGEQYRAWLGRIQHWIEVLPGLRTPRGEDGSGGTPPRPHQIRHGAIASQRPENFKAWTMGTGKTGLSIVVILCRFGSQLFAGLRGLPPGTLDTWLEKRGPEATGEYLLSKTEARPGSIHIAGLRIALDKTWMKELERMNLAWAAEIITCESQMAKSKAPIWIYDICNFPKLQSAKGRRMKRDGRGYRLKVTDTGVVTYFSGHSIAKVIAKRYPPSLLVADEAHRLQPKTERTRCFNIIRAKARSFLELTGTPMDGWVRQVAHLLAVGYGENTVAFPFTVDDFSRRFTKTDVVSTDMTTGGEAAEKKERTVPGVNHGQIPVFLKATRHLMHRLNLTDPEVKGHVVYPPVRKHIERIQPDFDHELFYKDMLDMGLGKYRTSIGHRDKSQSRSNYRARDFKARANALQLLNTLRMASVAPWAVGYEGGNTELVDRVIALVKGYAAEGRKCLVGTTFVEESRFIHERLLLALQEDGKTGVRLYATDPGAQKRTMSYTAREEAIERLMDEDDCVYMISTKSLVAESLNLSEYVSVLVSCSWDFRSNIELQWAGRVIRPGQSWPWVDYHQLMNLGTPDIYVYESQVRKALATAGIIDQDFGAEPVAEIDLFDVVDQIDQEAP